VSVREIAFGVCLAMFMGFIPLNGPMAVVLLIFFLLFKINRVATILTLPLFKLAYFAGVYKLADIFGEFLLIDVTSLSYFWRWFTHLPVIAYLDFNNTLVTGGLVLSAILFAPVFFASRSIVVLLRDKYNDKIRGTKLVQWFLRLDLVQKISGVANKIRGEE